MPGGESAPPTGRWWVLAPIVTGTFMGGLDTYIVNVSLPTITATFGAEVAVIQWVSLAYLVAITSSLVLCGRAATTALSLLLLPPPLTDCISHAVRRS